MTQPYGSLYRRGKIWWISYYVDGMACGNSDHRLSVAPIAKKFLRIPHPLNSLIEFSLA